MKIFDRVTHIRVVNRFGHRSRHALIMLLMLGFVLFGAACSSDMDERSSLTDPENNGSYGPGDENWGDAGQSGEPPFVPEEKVEFSFSKPAIVGERVFVANETLNS